jgi:hypothetical protein
VTERTQIAELLKLLASVRCVDSTLYIRVKGETLESFPGPTHVVVDDDGHEEFRSKRVLDLEGDPSTPGSGVTVELWAPPKHPHMKVA